MGNKIWVSVICLFLSMSLNHCTTSTIPGLVYNRTSQHVYGGASSGTQIQSHSILRSGKSCSFGSWFFLALFYYGGGGSISEAAEIGGIEKIAVVDRESTSIFYGLFYQECTVVWGE